MIVKPSIGFLTRDSNAQLIVSTETITSAMTDNPNYPAADSGIAQVIALCNGFKQATINANGGGYQLTAVRNALRLTLVNRLRLLSLYVELTCAGDMAVLLSSGFPVQKSQRTPSTILSAPMVQKVTPGVNSGTIAMKLLSLGALVYNWRCYQVDKPGEIIALPQTSAANTLFPNLTPGVTYVLQGNAVNAAGTSDWSAPYSQIAL